MAATSAVNKNESLISKYETILQLQLAYRCEQLTYFLENSPAKEWKCLFPKLVEHIFGFRTKEDWGLISLGHESRDYNDLKKFLAPNGPVLQLSYRLLEDQYARYEFPISCLPEPSRHALELGSVPSMYKYRAFRTSQMTLSSMLLLNAFDFYLFHFAYFITSPAVKFFSSIVNQADTVYASLLATYFMYFLPPDGSPVPLLPFVNSPPPPSNISPPSFQSTNWSPTKPTNTFAMEYSPNKMPSSPYSQPLPQLPRISLLKPGTVMMVNPVNSSSLGTYGQSKLETWRSEEFMSVITEMYLNHSYHDTSQGGVGLLTDLFVPNHYHVWMIRVLVKHVHYFVNSLISSSHMESSPVVIDSFGQLKSCLLPQYIQKNMYSFLKLTFDRWPMDASFRVPLETWLSYIQPWRYIDSKTEKEVCEKGIVNRWQKFVSDNVYFYTTMFLHVMHRFSRMDLSCPKNAFMLFRASKVFSQEDLDVMIIEAERSYLSSNPQTSYANISSYNLSYTDSPSKLNFLHLLPETNGSTYTSLFSHTAINQAYRVLSEIASARKQARLQDLHNNNSKKGFLSFFSGFFEERVNTSDDFISLDSRKLDFYLEAAANNICKLFKIPPATFTHLQNSHPVSPRPSMSRTLEEECDMELSPIRRIDAMHVESKMKKINNMGNPDRQPVRTYESAVLVKFFGDLSEFLNAKYGRHISELYFCPSVLGKVCQQLFAGPVDYYEITKSKDMQTVSERKVHLPPRVNLRVFANKHILLWLAIYFVGMCLCGFHPIITLFILLILLLLMLFLKASICRIKPSIKQD